MPKFNQTIIVSTLNGNSPLDKVEILNQLNIDGTAYYLRGESTGIIFYGNNYFLNYFESSKELNREHIRDTLNYPTHHAAKLIYKKGIPERNFNSWQMRYVQNEPRIQEFLSKNGFEAFNPYLLKDELLDKFIETLMTYADADLVHPIQSAKMAGRIGLGTYALGTIVILCLVLIIVFALFYFNFISFSSFLK